jgi:hypothetical protein
MAYTQDQCNTKGKRTLILHKNSTNCDSSREESSTKQKTTPNLNHTSSTNNIAAIAQQNSTKPHQQHLKTRKHSTI